MAFILINSLSKLFDEAAQKILEDEWTKLLNDRNCQDILPCPDLSVLPRIRVSNFALSFAGIAPQTERELKLKWTLWATEFFNSKKERINRNLYNIERHLADELATWNRNHPEKNEQLPLDKMHREWLASVEHVSLKEFTQLYIGPEAARRFLTPKFDELKERYGMYTSEQSISSMPAGKTLSLRQIALLYIYQGKTISRGKEADEIAKNYGYKSGEKLYKHYTSLSRTCDRTGVEGKAIKPFIADIEEVIPHLNDQHKQQAEREKRTIRAKN